MFLAITITSILAITVFVWLLGRISLIRICPICAGVSGTWLWMLAAKFLGYEIDATILAILMGGSVVGIAYQVEKRLSRRYSSLLWKSLFIPAGFIAVYSVISAWWVMSIPIVIGLIAMALVCTGKLGFGPSGDDMAARLEQSRRIKELEEKMKNCC